MTDEVKIEKLRIGIMCAVIQLFHTNPADVVETFTLDELDEIAKDTEDLCNEHLEGLFKDLLDMTKPVEDIEDEDQVQQE